MVINYIILAYKEPEQVKRLVERLYSSHSYIYIHIDLNVDARPFQTLLGNKARVIFLSTEKRVASVWGSLAVIEATLSAIKEVIKDNRHGYTVLMSGQCYPLKSNECIYSFFEKNYGYNFIEGFSPDAQWSCSDLRLKQYTFFMTSKRNDLITVPALNDIAFNKLLKRRMLRKYFRIFLHSKTFRVLFKQRRHPENLVPYGGMAYWALPLETLRFVMDFINNNPFFVKYHFYSLYPDELFFQTIIHNYFTKINHPVTFAHWPDDIVTSPQTFTTKEFNILRKRSELFARKFDYEVDSKILDLIDKELLYQENEFTK